MNAVVDANFSDNPIATPVLTQVFRDKISDSSIRDIYACCGMHPTTDPVNPVAQKFVTHGFYTVDALNKGTGIWSHATRVRITSDASHLSAADHSVGKNTTVGNSVGAKSYYSEANYKTDFEIWRENHKLQFERKNIQRSQPPLESTPVGVKTPDPKIPAKEYSDRKEKAQK